MGRRRSRLLTGGPELQSSKGDRTKAGGSGCEQSRPRSQRPKFGAAAAEAKSLQSCPTLCDPIDGSLPGSPVPRILQARTLEWVAISFSNA